MDASDIPEECIEDARFVKVLAASLCSEIAESKIILTEINTEIERSKEHVSDGWKKRKILKQSIYELSKKKQILADALESAVWREMRKLDQSKLKQPRIDWTTAHCEKFENALNSRIFSKIISIPGKSTRSRDIIIITVEYEKRPLAIERQKCLINLKQLGVQYMIAGYKKEEFMKMMRQRSEINSVRIKSSLVHISEMVLNRWKDEKFLEQLKKTTKKIRDELTAYTHQLSEMQQREMERKRLAESDDTAKMPPPRLHFPFMRPINYSDEKRIQQLRRKPRSKNSIERWRLARDESDTASINTLMLEQIFHEDSQNSLQKPKDSDEKSKNMANANENVQEEFHDMELPSSSLIFKQPTESARSIKNVSLKSAEVSSSSIIMNESNILRHKLKKLDIEKKNSSLAENHHNSQQREMINDEFNKSNNSINNNPHYNDNGRDNETKDCKNVEDSRHQRTRRWCEESTYKNLPSGIYPPNYNEDSRSPDEKINSPIMTECQIIVDEDDKRKEENLFHRHRNEEKKSKMYENEGNIRDAGGPRDGQQRDSMPGSRIHQDSTIQKCKSRNDYSTNDDEGSETKIRKYSTNENPGFMMEVEEQKQKLQRVLPAITTEHNQPANLSPSRRYVSSCTSSENLSHMVDAASWQATPPVGLPADLRENVDFPSLSNWANWSPPQLISEISFGSSSITDHQYDKKDDNPINQQITLQNNPFPDFGGFGKKTNQNPRKMF